MGDFDKANILVTGATGMICSALIEYLLENSTAKIYALGRSEKKLRAIFKNSDKERLVFLAQDVIQPIEIKEEIDYIFHGAGPIDSATIKTRPVDVILPNIQGLLNCGTIAQKQMERGKASPRIVVFSSATVYDIPQKEEVGEDPYKFREDDPLYTVNIDSNSACYFESKRMSEVLIKSMITQYGIDAVICRFSYVYGVPFFKPNTAFYQFIDTLKEGRDIVMNNAGLARRDNIYIDDVVSGLLTVAQSGKVGEVYNISSGCDKGNYAAIDEMAGVMIDIVGKYTGKAPKLVYKQEQGSKRAIGVALDNTKLKQLGWTVKISLREGIERILRNYELIP